MKNWESAIGFGPLAVASAGAEKGRGDTIPVLQCKAWSRAIILHGIIRSTYHFEIDSAMWLLFLLRGTYSQIERVE